MRKIIVGGAAVMLAASAAVATGASAGGNGAQLSPLGVNTGSDNSECESGATGGNGFVMVNAPGQPGAARFVLGEVSLKHGAPNTTFNVYLVGDGQDECQVPDAVLVTNNQGNGNAHIATDGTSGDFYVVLQDAEGDQQYASNQVHAS